MTWTVDTVQEKLIATMTNPTVQIAVLIFLLALAPRLMFMDHGLWQDEGRAMTTARNVLQGEGFHFRGEPMTQHPFTFYTLLAISFLLLGARDFTGILLVNILGALTAMLAFLIGKEVFNKWAGIAAGIFMMLTPIHWFVSGRVLNDIPVVFFMTLAAYLFILSENRESRKLFYAAAAVAGIAGLTKLSGLIVAPMFAVYALYKRGPTALKMKRYWIGAGLFLGLFAIWEVRNIWLVGEPIAVGYGAQLLGFAENTGGGGVNLGRNTNPLYYIYTLPQFLGFPVFLAFLLGTIVLYLYRFDIDAERLSPIYVVGGYLALSGVAVVAGLDVLVALYYVGILAVLAATYLYADDRVQFIIIYMLGVLLVFSAKNSNLLRYFLPFAPFAAVIAGYGVERVMQGVKTMTNQTAGLAAFVVILAASLFLLWTPGAANIEQSASGYAGLQEAGQWLEQNTPVDAAIMASSDNQIAWYSNRDNILRTYKADNRSTVDQFVDANNVQYIEIDWWEVIQRKKAPWAYQYFAQSPKYQPVATFGPRDPQSNMPAVVIYRVRN